MEIMDRLYRSLGPNVDNSPPASFTLSGFFPFFSRWLKEKAEFFYNSRETAVDFDASNPRLRGVYLYGPVGCGKTTMMDLFSNCLLPEQRQRVHFHQFMIDVHQKLHAKSLKTSGEDAITSLATHIRKKSPVLCLDEFVVNNIADAMVLGRLYEALLRKGVILITTSNFAPCLLYRNGLQRERFLPFIDLIKTTMDLVYVEHNQDYRRLAIQKELAIQKKTDRPAKTGKQGETWKGKLEQSYFHHKDPIVARLELQKTFRHLTGNKKLKPLTLKIGSRNLELDKTIDYEAVWLDYERFFEHPLGTADFIAVSKRFPLVAIANIPSFSTDKRNEARRFMTFVDTLYDEKRLLLISAEAEPDNLYPKGDGAFEFRRTASRLSEMQTIAYRGNLTHWGDW